MAHVLLPCDLPSWSDVQSMMLRMRSCQGVERAMVHIMAQVHETSSVSLDPDDSAPIRGHPGFEKLGSFLREEKLAMNILPDIAEWASKLPTLKPGNGIHYSLRTEESTLSLERSFVVSLLANAFFSTFPRRKTKTHPTLRDFNMADFFTYLDREDHRKKLQSFLRYFEGLEPEPDGTIQFTRTVYRGPSLPGWLCSERPLVPLVVRPQGSVDEAEPWVFRGYSCNSSVGENVLGESNSQESELFFEFPELLTCLCFLESLVEGEALMVESVRAPNTQDVNFCFLDTAECVNELDDRSLLQSLNKAVAAFTHEPRFVDRRRTPDGGESSEEGRLSLDNSRECMTENSGELLRCTDYPKMLSVKKVVKKSFSQASSKFSVRTASESSARLEEEYYTADEESEPESSSAADSVGLQQFSSSSAADSVGLQQFSSSSAADSVGLHQPSSTSAASVRSMGFVLAHSEDEDEDSRHNPVLHERLEDFRRRIRRRTRRRRKPSSRCSSYSNGSSSDMEDITEDPEEMPPVRPVVTIRPACSEPSLLTAAAAESVADISPWISPEALLSVSGQKELAATCSGGYLKSYSHDGVRPNLPVPFRARFRTKRAASDGSQDWDKSLYSSRTDDKEWTISRCPVAVPAADGGHKDPQLRAVVLWLAASMAQLPALILYTMNEPALGEVIQVYNQVLNRKWTIGDLACEVLRFCRNQTTPGHRTGKYPHLFGQLMAKKNAEEPASNKKLFTEESLD